MQQNIIQPIDWSATISAIALVVSITGTILGPIITTILTNRHQLKLHKMDIEEKHISEYEASRFNAINAFISSVGRYFSNPCPENETQLGTCFHTVYQYVPQEYWVTLDNFYSDLISENWDKAQNTFPNIVHYLSKILKESPQLHH